MCTVSNRSPARVVYHVYNVHRLFHFILISIHWFIYHLQYKLQFEHWRLLIWLSDIAGINKRQNYCSPVGLERGAFFLN